MQARRGSAVPSSESRGARARKGGLAVSDDERDLRASASVA
jgi:hypothetical protein